MRITLCVTAGPHQGREFFAAGRDSFLVGRSKRCRFQLASLDRRISRLHFFVEIDPSHCYLSDVGGRNGTRVNGRKVETAELCDGDEIRIGNTTLRVALQPDLPELSPTVGEVPPPPARPAPAAGRCRACAAAPAAAGPLCSSCEEKARGREQPIPGYCLIEELGHGNMGIVYRALDPDGLPVAVKTIKPGPDVTLEQVERFLRESRIVRRLDHPHVVRFFDRGRAGDLLYFVMEHVLGPDARRWLKAHHPAPVGQVVCLACQMLEALAYAHARGYVHRDIKPGNLLLAEQSGRLFVKLADFGLARAYQESSLSRISRTGEAGGTLAFMAPEQLTDFHRAGPAADQYSAAATLYNLLTGRYVHDLEGLADYQRLKQVIEGKPVPVGQRGRDLPAGLAAAIDRALAREPRRRFADVAEFRAALLPFAEGAEGERTKPQAAVGPAGMNPAARKCHGEPPG
ncbi:MAG TPA: FHA domain-containing serine/threonine-protein kinase [Gemmataceae bacterium]|nr:FHA domain-containing serine/threonine-protein kinase [Gemmataceae bacterium]